MRSQHYGYWCHGAKASGHQYPQCWLNIHCIGPILYKDIAHTVNSIRKWNHILKKMTHPGLLMPHGIIDLGQHWCSGNCWCQISTKKLPKPLLAVLAIGPSVTNLIEISFKIQKFSFKEMYLKMSLKQQRFFSDLNVLIHYGLFALWSGRVPSCLLPSDWSKWQLQMFTYLPPRQHHISLISCNKE